MSCERSCLIGGHVLWEDMPYKKTYLSYLRGENVLYDDMFMEDLVNCNHSSPPPPPSTHCLPNFFFCCGINNLYICLTDKL